MRFKFMDGRPVEYVQLRLTPDRTVDNKKVHDLFRALSSFYVTPLERLQGRKAAGALWWDVMLRNDEIRFYCTVPADWKREILMQLEHAWPLASIEEMDVWQTVIPVSASVCEMKYRRSNMFALQVDRRLELEPMRSILSITGEMHAGDMTRLSICAEPASRLDWQEWAERQHKEFQKGRTPRRTRLTKRDLFVTFGEAVSGLLQAALDVLHAAVGGEEQKPAKGSDDQEKRLIMIDGSLAKGTVNKRKAPTFNTYIRIAASSPDTMRQQIILRTMSNSFNDLTADNELERAEIGDRLRPVIIRELNTFRISWPTRLDPDKNVMSNEELGRLVELPTAALQDEHRDRMETLDNRQIEVPAALTRGGIRIGEVAFKKQTVPVAFPVKDWDQLCLPTVAIGGMGSGKT
ncbi:hypothetical protein, partial [Gorillibacterium sp. sgz5001074]|uniref:hypothetical protein n=1 Tax=Gorillibacterium sp. sgz5001074 TaxID=3446695 RepID=UPI003F681400